MRVTGRHASPRLLTTLTMLTFLLSGLFTSVGALPAAAAGGVDIYVGYADNLRANPANFPTPWEGSPNTIYEGCSGGCTFDAGAVRVVNSTGSPVTMNSVVIRFDTCIYDIWPHNVSLPAGGQIIVTQTTSGADNGCSPGNGHMDSSDIGPGGVGWAGVCTESNIFPVVDVTVDGTTTSFTDSAQVLNTDGMDRADCNGGANESLQWSPIGTVICVGSALLASPLSQSLPEGSLASVSAHYSNTCNDPLSNVTVNFAVTAGPNAGLTGSGVTDANGDATFSYTSASLGQDTVQASVSNPAGTISANPVTVTWVNTPPTVAPDQPSVTVNEGTTATNTGTVGDADGDAVSLSASLGSVVNNGDGTWSWSYATTDGPAQSQTVTISATDGKVVTPVTTTFSLTVNNVAPTIASLTGPRQALTGATFTLTATATDPSTVDTAAGFAWNWSLGVATGNTDAVTPTSCGSQMVSVTAADKDGGVSAPATTTVAVYEAHFREPLNEGVYNTVQKGRVVPVKIVVGCNGATLTGLSPAIQLLKGDATAGSEAGTDPVETLSVSAADTTGFMRAVDGGYIYNLQVPSNATSGQVYTIRVRPFGDSNPAASMYIALKIK